MGKRQAEREANKHAIYVRKAEINKDGLTAKLRQEESRRQMEEKNARQEDNK